MTVRHPVVFLVVGERVTTVLPLQGQFATDAEIAAARPAADVTIAGVGDLVGLEL